MNNSFIIILALLLALCPFGLIAQNNFYYYIGERIPLTPNNEKVCVSIPNNGKSISADLLKNISTLHTIKDADFDIFVIQESDLSNLSDSGLNSEELESVSFSPCFMTNSGTEVFLTPYLNVRLKTEQDISILSLYAKQYGLNIVKKDSLLPLWYVLSVSPASRTNALEIANALWESGKFDAAVPDLCSDDDICSNDPMFSLQWGLYNSNYANIDISIQPAWEYATGKNVKIAILDQGVDVNHIDLASNISSLSYDTETNSSPSVCYGDHGTHCAGIAAAVKDNGIQIAGVAPDATIVSISNSLSSTTNSQLKRADGIVWAYQHGVDIISNSWSSPIPHAAIDEAIHDAFIYGRQGKGCVIVFASGNKKDTTTNIGVVKYPANCNDTILAVGSITNDGARAESSHYGAALDVVAPGVNILSTLLNNLAGYKSGTSMACPHVAGVAALILERNSELTVTQVNSIINGSAKKIEGVDFDITKSDGTWNEEYGYGLVDAYNAVINTPGTVYIQNETITGSRIISAADKVYVGRDVTNDKPYGNVRLGPGQIAIKAKSVTVKNSTSVPLGTTLTIANQ